MVEAGESAEGAGAALSAEEAGSSAAATPEASVSAALSLSAAGIGASATTDFGSAGAISDTVGAITAVEVAGVSTGASGTVSEIAGIGFIGEAYTFLVPKFLAGDGGILHERFSLGYSSTTGVATSLFSCRSSTASARERFFELDDYLSSSFSIASSFFSLQGLVLLSSSAELFSGVLDLAGSLEGCSLEAFSVESDDGTAASDSLTSFEVSDCFSVDGAGSAGLISDSFGASAGLTSVGVEDIKSTKFINLILNSN